MFRLSEAMHRFSEVIEDLELRDLPLLGGSFTWRGGLHSYRKSRLDWFLISSQWEELFRDLIQSLLPRPVFDHFPLLLEGGERSCTFQI